MENERRRYARFKDPSRPPIRLLWEQDGLPQTVQALVADESFDGIGLVHTGDPLFQVGDEPVWRESDKVHTRLEVIRVEQLYDGVQFVATKIRGVTQRRRHKPKQ